MQTAHSLRPLDDYAFAAAPRDRRELGGIAAASSRSGPRSRASSAATARTSPLGALGPWAWIFAGFMVWGLLVGARTQIVRLVPGAAPLYAAIGLGVNLRRMDIENVVSRLADEDGRQILVVEGEIRNLADSPRAAPRMRLSVLDANGREVYFWTAAPPKARLLAGEKAQFRARLATPPKEGRDVRVRFAGEA